MYCRSLLVGVIALSSMAAAGCRIYLDEDDDGVYDDGCFEDWCSDDGGWTGAECDSDYDCLAGCYCDEDTGTCQPSPTCEDDDDCPNGFECDSRSTCVPEDPSDECTRDDQCPEGSFCDERTGECVDSSGCRRDDECPTGQICDEERRTCIPAPCDDDSDCPDGYCNETTGQCVESPTCDRCPEGMECNEDTNRCVPVEPEPPTCQGEVTCSDPPPSCPDGTNPGIVNGCYNGQCIADADCPDGPPIFCSDHTTEAECIADEGCEPVYRGINCRDPNNVPCTEPSSMCICESYRFYECADETP